jgi:hypothetical protein
MIIPAPSTPQWVYSFDVQPGRPVSYDGPDCIELVVSWWAPDEAVAEGYARLTPITAQKLDDSANAKTHYVYGRTPEECDAKCMAFYNYHNRPFMNGRVMNVLRLAPRIRSISA